MIGVCAAIKAFATDMEILKRDMPINIGVTVLLFLFLLDGKLSRIEGIVLLIGLVVYLIVVVRSALKNRTEIEKADADEGEKKQLSIPMIILYILGGLLAIVWGGDLVVDNAQRIALSFGMSPMLVGLTIVAMGTSLPELVTSIVASRKGESGLALGNAVGSCLFNILFILGMSSVISPLHVLDESVIDCLLLTVSAVILYLFARSKKKMTRLEGVICILLYISYTAYLLIR